MSEKTPIINQPLGRDDRTERFDYYQPTSWQDMEGIVQSVEEHVRGVYSDTASDPWKKYTVPTSRQIGELYQLANAIDHEDPSVFAPAFTGGERVLLDGRKADEADDAAREDARLFGTEASIVRAVKPWLLDDKQREAALEATKTTDAGQLPDELKEDFEAFSEAYAQAYAKNTPADKMLAIYRDYQQQRLDLNEVMQHAEAHAATFEPSAEDSGEDSDDSTATTSEPAPAANSNDLDEEKAGATAPAPAAVPTAAAAPTDPDNAGQPERRQSGDIFTADGRRVIFRPWKGMDGDTAAVGNTRQRAPSGTTSATYYMNDEGKWRFVGYTGRTKETVDLNAAAARLAADMVGRTVELDGNASDEDGALDHTTDQAA